MKYMGQKLEIHEDNVYTLCAWCGKEHAVDIQEILSSGDADLYGTAVYCAKCSQIRSGLE